MNKPTILISACLEFDKVRYNGQSIPSDTVRDLIPFVNVIKVCPEFEIGLGVPREPIRIVKVENEYRLIQHNTNRDVTDDMNNFSEKYISELKDVDGFIFKSKSPTMGVKDIKVYSGMKGAPVVEKCGGFFAGRIAKQYEGYPIEEEDRLRNKRIREHFLTKLFLFSEFRQSNNIEEFHKKNKLLFEFYNYSESKLLDFNQSDYFEKLKKIFLKFPDSSEILNFFERNMNNKNIIAKYKKNIISLETIKEIIQLEYNDNQTFFKPFPEELISKVDEDRDKNYWKDI